MHRDCTVLSYLGTMKYALLVCISLILASCGGSKNTTQSVERESQLYKMFNEIDGVLGQTPAMVTVDIVPAKDGFYRLQQLEGPGVIFIDSLLMDPYGKPVEHTFIIGKNKTTIFYEDDHSYQIWEGDTLKTPYENPFVYDVIQMDLVLRGIDTAGTSIDLPVYVPQTGSIAFFTVQEIRQDSIPPHWLTRETIPTVHRFASSPGATYEGWYVEDEILPIKMRVTSGGSTLVYLRYVAPADM